MHPTADTTALIFGNLAGRRVMPGVSRTVRSFHHMGTKIKLALEKGDTKFEKLINRLLDIATILKWPIRVGVILVAVVIISGIGMTMVLRMPLVALGGSPKHDFRAGRGGRTAALDNEWKDSVISALERSKAVFIIPAPNPGTLWEMELIASRPDLGVFLEESERRCNVPPSTRRWRVLQWLLPYPPPQSATLKRLSEVRAPRQQ